MTLPRRTQRAKRCDIAIVIAIKEEFAVLWDALAAEPQTPERADRRVYYPFTFPDSHESIRNGVATFIGDMGISEARGATQWLLSRWHPRLLVCVGISGMLSDDLHLGDIVVGTDVQQYGYRSKARQGRTLEEYDIALGGRPYSCDKEIGLLIDNLDFTHKSVMREWCSGASVFLDKMRVTQIGTQLAKERLLPREGPRVVSGQLASGDMVVKSSAFKAALLEHNPNFLAVDMESAGVLAAVSDQAPRSQPATLILRAISDPADKRKTALDSKTRGAIREWAMRNACAFLSSLLRRTDLLSRLSHASGREQLGQETDTGEVQRLEAQLHRLVAETYLGAFPAKEAGTAEALKAYSQLLDVLATSTCFTGPDKVQAAADFVMAGRTSLPLQIEGAAGSGKTLFLAILYQLLRRKRDASPSAPIPFYIDVSLYDAIIYSDPPGSFKEKALRECKGHLEPLFRIVSTCPRQPVIVLIDGLDNCGRFQSVVVDYIAEVCSTRSGVKKVLALKLTGETTSESETILMGAPEALITMRGVQRSKHDIRKLVQLFQKATGLAGDGADVFVENRTEAFGLPSVDLRTTAVLLSKRDQPHYRDAKSSAQFYLLLCQEELQRVNPTADVAQLLERAAELAFDTTIGRKMISDGSIRRDPAWRLIHLHETVRDFLIAHCFVTMVVKFGGDEALNDSRLTIVFPASITRFCKELINLDITKQQAVLHSLAKSYQRADYKQQTVLSYLAGRLENKSFRDEARKYLNRRLEKLRHEDESSVRATPGRGSTRGKRPAKRGLRASTQPNAKDRLLLYRTLYISLVCLDDRNASRDYLAKLLTDKTWDDLNRGFHLEYYGDIPYHPGSSESLANKDRLDDFDNTYSHLTARIRGNIGRPRYQLFELELYTLCSLAQHRYSEGRLESGIRSELLKLLDEVLGAKRLSNPSLQDYVSMVRIDLRRPRFEIGCFAEELFRVKTHRRAGWVRRNILNAESIADHSYGAYLLGLLYLPETIHGERSYSKRTILDMLLVHDLPEAFTGDIPSPEKTEEDDEKEREWGRYIGMLSSYRGVANSLRRSAVLYDEFARGQTRNARVARDIDKAEMLLQAYVYLRAGQDVAGLADLRTSVNDHTRTREGRRILNLVEAWFSDLTEPLERSRS